MCYGSGLATLDAMISAKTVIIATLCFSQQIVISYIDIPSAGIP